MAETTEQKTSMIADIVNSTAMALDSVLRGIGSAMYSGKRNTNAELVSRKKNSKGQTTEKYSIRTKDIAFLEQYNTAFDITFFASAGLAVVGGLSAITASNNNLLFASLVMLLPIQRIAVGYFSQRTKEFVYAVRDKQSLIAEIEVIKDNKKKVSFCELKFNKIDVSSEPDHDSPIDTAVLKIKTDKKEYDWISGIENDAQIDTIIASFK